jgi:hypothetical protein
MAGSGRVILVATTSQMKKQQRNKEEANDFFLRRATEGANEIALQSYRHRCARCRFDWM